MFGTLSGPLMLKGVGLTMSFSQLPVLKKVVTCLLTVFEKCVFKFVREAAGRFAWQS